MFERLQQSAERYREIERLLADPAVHARPAGLAGLLREMGALKDKALAYERWQDLQQRLATAASLAQGDDRELGELAREEVAEIEAELAAMADELRRQVVDDDPNRGRNVIIEVRAGTGGDEASLFAADLVRLYSRFAERNGLKRELLSSHPTEVGGYKEVVLGVAGARAWDLFRFESGGHRVQRVPATEAQGRIHTSAATVAVLPEVEEVEVQIDEGDLRVDSYRAGGPGGQNVNKTSSAIRITHLPTGIVVQCQDESSQHKNKSKAMRMLRARIHEADQAQRKQAEDAARRAQIGSGDRSERIRTYNFPQDRVTDHRIKTSYSLESVLMGNLDEVVEDLRRRDLEARLAVFGDGAA